MKFRLDLGKVKTIILAAVALISVAVIIFDIVLLAGAGNIRTSNPVVVSVGLAAAGLVAFFALMLIFNSYYKLDKENIVAVMGFFVSRINYDSIVTVRQNSQTKMVSLELSLNGTDEQILGSDTTEVTLNVRAVDSDIFLDELKKHCDAIIEIITPEKKENK